MFLSSLHKFMIYIFVISLLLWRFIRLIYGTCTWILTFVGPTHSFNNSMSFWMPQVTFLSLLGSPTWTIKKNTTRHTRSMGRLIWCMLGLMSIQPSSSQSPLPFGSYDIREVKCQCNMAAKGLNRELEHKFPNTRSLRSSWIMLPSILAFQYLGYHIPNRLANY